MLKNRCYSSALCANATIPGKESKFFGALEDDCFVNYHHLDNYSGWKVVNFD